MILRSRFRDFVPVVVLFVVVNALVISLRSNLAFWHISEDVLIGGNLFLFVVTFISYLIARRGLQKQNTNAFIRAIYGSILFKLFICLIGAFAYIAVQQKGLNKGAFFISMGLYLVYTFLEVSILTRLLRRKPNE